jgi:hypothetical protein
MVLGNLDQNLVVNCWLALGSSVTSKYVLPFYGLWCEWKHTCHCLSVEYYPLFVFLSFARLHYDLWVFFQ